MGVVLFTLIVGFASGREAFSLQAVGMDFLREALGGAALGIVFGYIAYRAMRRIDDFPIEVLITLALVTGTYTVAQRLGASGPIATVAAGLLVGHRAPKDAMSDEASRYVGALWTLIDEVLNAVLFLLIGLEVVVLSGGLVMWIAAVARVPIVLLTRFISVALPALMPIGIVHRRANIPFLTWAGIRGGISIALALSPPPSDAKTTILAATYLVVLFSIFVQGLTLPRVVKSLRLGEVM